MFKTQTIIIQMDTCKFTIIHCGNYKECGYMQEGSNIMY